MYLMYFFNFSVFVLVVYFIFVGIVVYRFVRNIGDFGSFVFWIWVLCILKKVVYVVWGNDSVFICCCMYLIW